MDSQGARPQALSWDGALGFELPAPGVPHHKPVPCAVVPGPMLA